MYTTPFTLEHSPHIIVGLESSGLLTVFSWGSRRVAPSLVNGLTKVQREELLQEAQQPDVICWSWHTLEQVEDSQKEPLTYDVQYSRLAVF
jgi:hypothetical protein